MSQFKHWKNSKISNDFISIRYYNSKSQPKFIKINKSFSIFIILLFIVFNACYFYLYQDLKKEYLSLKKQNISDQKIIKKNNELKNELYKTLDDYKKLKNSFEQLKNDQEKIKSSEFIKNISK